MDILSKCTVYSGSYGRCLDKGFVVVWEFYTFCSLYIGFLLRSVWELVWKVLRLVRE